LFTRVFSSILDSSLNVQSVPVSVRWLWITMLLIADDDQTGVVDMPVERLAARAGLTVEQTREALDVLGAPDPDSSSDDEDGRRIVPLEPGRSRGWRLVNWEKYKAISTAEHQRQLTRSRVAAYRERHSAAETGKRTETALESTNGNGEVGSQGSGPENAAAKELKQFSNGSGEASLLPTHGIGAIEIVTRTIHAIAPATKAIDDVEVSLWLRDISPDPWWIAATICEAQLTLIEKPRAARYVKSILRRCADEAKTYDDAEGYVTYFISPERQNKMNTSTM
jgi:hypothetical protein